mgnify:CR=1 FL=1
MKFNVSGIFMLQVEAKNALEAEREANKRLGSDMWTSIITAEEASQWEQQDR